MEYFSNTQPRRLTSDSVNRQIYEQVINLRRQRENDFRRLFHSMIHDDQNRLRQKHHRSSSQRETSRNNRYDSRNIYEELPQYRSISHSHHRQTSQTRECSLITVLYHGLSNGRRHGEEIVIIQSDRTVFKGCVRPGDSFTFKCKRFRNDSRVKLDFYINDVLADRMTGCCAHVLSRRGQNQYFQISNILGSRPCERCVAENDTNSSRSSSVSRVSNTETAAANNVDASPKSKLSTTSNTQQKTVQNRQPKTEQRSSNHQKSQAEKSNTLSVPQPKFDKASSEGFSADVSELSEIQQLKTIRVEDTEQQQQQQRAETEEDSARFLPIHSPTDRESPPPSPPKRTYGPPQLSTMLSVIDPSESYEERNETSELTNSEEKKDSDSTNDENQTEDKQSNRIDRVLRTISSNTENNSDGQTTEQPSSTNTNHHLSIADDATQLLLARLGIMRQQQVERPEVSAENTPRQRGNVEYFVLVYLNSTAPDEQTVKHLRSFVNFTKIFDDTDDCIAFINSISNEKVLLILSESFSDSILPRIDDLQQIFTIYIFHQNNKDPKHLQNRSTKIQGVYSNLDEIYPQIALDINEITRDLIAYMTISGNATSLDPMFVFSQLLSEIILDSEETDSAMKELVNFVRQEYDGNEKELALLEEFENEYDKSRAIWWFTRQCFLSKMLNKALRVPEADVLFKLRLFIQHLHYQIRNEAVTNQSLTVYLGQTIHQNDLDDLQKRQTNNSLLVFSQFLFSTTDLHRAIDIAKKLPLISDEYIPVVLHLNIPSNIGCANTSSLRYVTDDDNDVLLNIGIIGRLVQIDKDNQNETGVASVYLTLTTCENERNIQQMLETKRNEVKGPAPLVTLIKLMLVTSQQARAEQLVHLVYDDQSIKSDDNIQGSIAASCHILGGTCHARGDFKRAAELFHLSLDAFLRFVPADSQQLSPTYNNIGSMYFRQEKYVQAAEYHQKALDVQLNSDNPNLNSIASYSNNVGVVELKQAKYKEAAKSFERALKILLQINEPNNPEVASTYDNIADAYFLQEKYEQALTYYSKALETQQSILPPNPQALASYNNSIGNIYNKMHRYGDALVHFTRALECHQEYLPKAHPSFASLYNNIGSMYYRQEQYNEALPYYLKSLEIELMSLPENHPTIAVTHFNIATTYTGLGRFEEAIQSTERSVEQLLKTLPADHSEVIENRAYIQTIKRKQMLKELFDANTTSS